MTTRGRYHYCYSEDPEWYPSPHPRYHPRYHYSGEVARCARVVPRSCPHTPDTVLALVYR